jgi:AcrR family transcriptional regulator
VRTLYASLYAMGSQARAARSIRSRRRHGDRRTADAPLSRERIVAAGLELLHTRGGGELSIRALADALGTAPMSLYRHVRSKDELLSAIVAAVLERLRLDVPAKGPWTKRVSAWMHSMRQQLLQSPAAVAILIERGQYAPALLRATNTLLRILRQAGFEGGDAVRASREVMWSTLGFVSAEIRGPRFSPSFYMQALRAADGNGTALHADDVAEVAAHMPHMLTRDLDEVFAFIVKHLIAGLAAERAEA